MAAQFIVKLLTKLGIIKYLNLYLSSGTDGLKVRVPVIGGVGQQNFSVTEPWMLDLFRRYADTFGAGSFLDVGANLGQTLIKYKAVFEKNTYIGFEPNATCASYVGKLIESNKWSNCHILPTAVADRTGIRELLLYYDKDVDAGASLIDGFRENEHVTRAFNVAVLNLDNTGGLKELIGRLACIKIDVEGAEYEVIKSCHQIIQAQRPLLLVEILPAYDASNAIRIGRQQEIEKILHHLNYELYVVVKDYNNCLQELKKIETIGINNDIQLSDYLFVPAEAGMELAPPRTR